MMLESIKLWGLVIFISALIISNMYFKEKSNHLQSLLDQQAAAVSYVEHSLKTAETENNSLSEALSKKNTRIKAAKVLDDCQESMDWMVDQLKG